MTLYFNGAHRRNGGSLTTHTINGESDSIMFVLNNIEYDTISRLYVKHTDENKSNGVKVKLSKTNDFNYNKMYSIVSGDVVDNSNFLIPSLNKYIVIEGINDKNPVEVQFISTSDYNVYSSNEPINTGNYYGYGSYKLPKHPDYPDHFEYSIYEVEDTIVTNIETHFYDWDTPVSGGIKVEIDTRKLESSDSLYELPITFYIDASTSFNTLQQQLILGTPKYNFIPELKIECWLQIDSNS